MNDELQRELTRWLAGTRETAGALSDEAVTQMRGLVGEMVRVGRIEMTFWLLVWVVGIWLGHATFVGGHKEAEAEKAKESRDNSRVDAAMWITLIGLALVVGSLVMALACLHGFLTAWFAPRVFVVEHLAELIGKVKGG